MADPILEARDIVKNFGRVRALRAADFSVNRAEVVALVGDLGKLGFLDKAEMHRRAGEAFGSLGVGLQDSKAPVANMSGGQRQGVAVSRAVTWASKVVFMDEPTAALGVVQTRHVLDLIRRVRERGLAVVLISHNMPEVFEVADRIEVLRLGERVARFRRGDVSMEDVVGAMTGAITHDDLDR